MLRPEFVLRKLALIADDLGNLAGYRDDSREALVADPIRLAAAERFLERIVLRAVDVNEHDYHAYVTAVTRFIDDHPGTA